MIKFNSKLFKSLRLKAGFTQASFADKLRKDFPKASKSLVSHWERGTTPHAPYLSAISKILGMGVESFFKQK